MAFTTVPGSGATDATSYIGSLGNDVITLSSTGPAFFGSNQGNDRINFSSPTRQFSITTLKGGAGSDQLRATDGLTAINGGFINLNAGDDFAYINNLANATLKGGTGRDDLSLKSLNSAFLNSNKGGDTVTVAGASSSTLRTGQGGDTLNASGTYISTSLMGDNDNDTITLGNNASLTTTNVNGNAGNDTITINAIDAFFTSSIQGGAGSDTIDGSASGVALNLIGNADNDSISGGTVADTIRGGTGLDTIDGGAGADTMTAGNGDDVFTFNTGDVANGESIDGGTDSQTNGDLIEVDSATDFTNLGTATILTAGNVENIRIDGAFAATFVATQLTGQAININDNNTGVATLDINTNGAATYNFSALTFGAVTGTAFADGTDVIDIDESDGTAVNITGTTFADFITSTAGTDTLIGGTGADTIASGNAVDSIEGGVGNDSITGGASADNLTGGDGDDTFGFAAAEFVAGETLNGGANTDTILVTDDAQTIADAAFTNKTLFEVITLANGNNSLTLGTNAAAATASLTVNGGTGQDIIDASALGEIAVITTGAEADSVSGGTAADSITTADGLDSITSGAGNDTINAGLLVDTVDAGSGSDTITGGGGLDSFRFANDDSSFAITGTGDVGVIANYDRITDYELGTGTTLAEVLDGTTQAYTVGAVAAAVDSTLTVGGQIVDTSNANIANGIIVFDDALGAVITVDSNAKLAAVTQALNASDIGAAGSSLAFVGSVGGTATTWLYSQTGATAGGNLIQLDGVTGLSLTATNATTAGLIAIA